MKYVAQQVKVDPTELVAYNWSGRTIKYDQARSGGFGFPESTRGDEQKVTAWFVGEVCPVELNEGRLRDALLARCRADRVEPPGGVKRILGAAGATFEQRLATTSSRDSPPSR